LPHSGNTHSKDALGKLDAETSCAGAGLALLVPGLTALAGSLQRHKIKECSTLLIIALSRNLRAGLRTFYLRFLTRKHRLNNFEASFYRNVDFVRQVALLADLHGEIIGGARYYIWSPGHADIAFIVGDAYQNKGIASGCLHHLALIARDAGISDLHAHTLPDNRRALRVLALPVPAVLKQPRKRGNEPRLLLLKDADARRAAPRCDNLQPTTSLSQGGHGTH
jgi:GNAT superfamily N-acetyltransferase